VLDIGSQTIKCGFSRDASPRASIPTIVGRRPAQKPSDPLFPAEEAFAQEGLVIRQSPVERSLITNWNHLEVLLRHVFSKTLASESSEFPLVVTSHLYPQMNREKMTQIIFEKFNVPSFYIVEQATVALYASDLSTGIVLTSGHGACHTVPVFEGHTLGFAMQHTDIAGYDISNYVRKLLGESGGVAEPYSKAMNQDIENIKKMACVSSLEPSANQLTHAEIPYILYDGSIVKDIGPILRRCAEPFFNPQIIDIETESIQQSIATSAIKCHPDIRSDLLANIVLAGGNTLFQGLAERLETELKSVLHPSASFRVHAPSDRLHSSWKGAAKLANRPEFPSIAISKEEYEEYGPDISRLKCF
jgi:actin beta/gamma 1